MTKRLIKGEEFITTGWGIVAIAATLAGVSIVLLGAAALSSEYTSKCAPDATSGKQVCTTSFEWKGWSGIPLQSLASMAGMASGAYVLYLKKQQPGGGSDAAATTEASS